MSYFVQNPYFYGTTNYGNTAVTPSNWPSVYNTAIPMQTRSIQGIAGHPVNSQNDILPNEVPMDGSMALFPKNDYSCVYGKMWKSDGTIQTMIFVPQVPETKPQEVSMNDLIMNRLNEISELQQKLVKELTSNGNE